MPNLISNLVVHLYLLYCLSHLASFYSLLNPSIICCIYCISLRYPSFTSPSPFFPFSNN